MKYTYFVDRDPEIASLMHSVCAWGASQIATRSSSNLRIAGYEQSRARAEEALPTSKHPPRSIPGRLVKLAFYAMQYNAHRNYFENVPSVAVAWNGIQGNRRLFMEAARDAGRPTLFMERAPLPGRVTVDSTGINQQSSVPRDPAFFHDWASQDTGRTGRDWMRMKEKLEARVSRRSDVGQQSGATDGLGAPYVFCPLQVPDDTQVRQFGGWVGSMERLLDVLSDAVSSLPSGWHLRLKEHPSSRVPLGHLLSDMTARHGARVVIDNATDTFRQVDHARVVLTLNSSVGLQAFFFEKPVMVLGEAFFRLPGLVTPVDDLPHLQAAFASVAGADFDATLRNAFMNYLDQVYYPEKQTGPDGRSRVSPDLLVPKLPRSV